MSDNSPRFRQVLESFAPYRPGQAPIAPDGRSFKLSSNESPDGPLPSVLAVLAQAATALNRYPDNGCVQLTAAIARRLAVPAGHIAVGCGSVGITQQLLAAVAEPGAEVMYAWRSFEAYPQLADLTGATSVRVPLRDATHDLDAMADAITDRTRLIFVCNPNNPTGTVVGRGELTRFLDRVPADCLVVLDEAYHEYVRDPDVPDGITLYADRPNLAVLRTFSKAYGLAALRVGYLIGHEPVADAIRKTQLPFSVNALAQSAAIASLAAEAELLDRVELVLKERGRVRGELLDQGWQVPPTQANFVWLPLGEQTADFTAACGAAGIGVRGYQSDGVRVSIGDPEENDAFLAVAKGWGALKVYVLHENPDWFVPIGAALQGAGIPYEQWLLGEAVVSLDEQPPAGVFWSRMSASSHTRGHPHAKDQTRGVLAWLQSHGRPVVNGRRALELEMSKVDQLVALRAAGFDVPRTTAVAGTSELSAAARKLPVPFVSKHNQGGKGLGVRLFSSHDEFDAYLAGPDYEAPVDGITLLQEYLVAAEPRITRAEIVGGEFIYAITADTARGGFQLCPADACAVDQQPGAASPGVAEPSLFALRQDFEHPVTARYAEFAARHGIEIAGFEFIETADGRLVTYDINTTTNYNAAIEAVAPRPALEALVSYLRRLLAA